MTRFLAVEGRTIFSLCRLILVIKTLRTSTQQQTQSPFQLRVFRISQIYLLTWFNKGMMF